MSDTDPLPRPPRRRINGVTWGYRGDYLIKGAGILWAWNDKKWLNSSPRLAMNCPRVGYAMGCVKDDDGQLPDRFTEEAL